jgi:ParB-like chromosome segregation protein Spo0J
MSQPEPYQVMPPLSDEAFEELKNSIRKYGVLVPVIRDNLGRTLDGHQRQRALDELRAEGVKVDCQSDFRPNLTEQGKVELAREVNLIRRHLPPQSAGP